MVSYLVAYTKYAVTLEAQFILFLQNLVGERNAFLQKTSKLSDPAYAIAILFPVFASLDSNLGGQLLLVSAVTEWTNTLLKWSLMEGRPYWWVREERVLVPLRQSETTCETGPGSPSAHVMGAAAFLYVFIRWFRLRLQDVQIQKQKRANVAMWIIFSILITLVSLSRMNIATHFPHQCVLGCILGILVSKFLTEDYRWAIGKKLSGMGKSKMLMLAIFISSASAFFYWMQQLLGIDPGWSIKLAFKWCKRPETISVHTTPLYSLVRDCGCLFGVALAWPIKTRQFYPLVGAIVATLFFVSTRLLRPLMPTNDPLQFYTFHFLEHVFICFCLLTIIPYIASLVKLKEKKN